MELTLLRDDNLLAHAEVLISNVVASTESQRAYRRAIRELIDWCERRRETDVNKAIVNSYRLYLISRNLSPATINQKLSAIRTLATELGDSGRMSPTVAAAVARVKGVKSHGVRLGQWLSPTDADRLLEAPDRTTLKGKRDRALLAVGLSCGLRRNEIAKLTVETIQQRSGRWVLVDIIGKQGRIRSVPIAPWAKDSINDWLSAAGIDIGFVFRAINKTGCVRAGKISAQAVYEIIKGYGVDIAVTVAPHDLRRSFARLAHSGNSPIEQIQLSLGHASIATTERYIGVRQNLSDAPCDRLGIMLPGNPCPVFEDEEWTTRDVEPDGWERFLPAAPIVTTLYASGWAVAGAAYTMFADFSGEDFGRRSTVGA